MSLFLVRVGQKLVGDALRLNAAGHEVMAPVSKRTHDLGCQRLVQQLEDCRPVR